MVRHLFQRTITKNGKKVKAWYYWFYDENGKQVRKSCGQNGKPCLIKRDAEAFIASLKDEDLISTSTKSITFNDYCQGFYDPDSRFIKKQAARGFNYQENSLYQKRLYVKKFLAAFGDMKVTEIRAGEIENWVIVLECSNSVKNTIIVFIA